MIERLNHELKYRDFKIKKITGDYVKELSHWKDIISRQEDDEYQYYQVEYFKDPDEPQLSEEACELMNRKIKILKASFEHRTRALNRTIYDLHQKIADINKIVSVEREKARLPASTLEELLQRERDPHVLWAKIARAKGPFFLIRALTERKENCDIKYAELFDMLNQRKLVGVFIHEFKESLKQSYCKDRQACLLEVAALKKTIASREAFELKRLEEVEREQFAREQRLQSLVHQLGNNPCTRCESMQLKLFFARWACLRGVLPTQPVQPLKAQLRQALQRLTKSEWIRNELQLRMKQNLREYERVRRKWIQAQNDSELMGIQMRNYKSLYSQCRHNLEAVLRLAKVPMGNVLELNLEDQASEELRFLQRRLKSIPLSQTVVNQILQLVSPRTENVLRLFKDYNLLLGRTIKEKDTMTQPPPQCLESWAQTTPEETQVPEPVPEQPNLQNVDGASQEQTQYVKPTVKAVSFHQGESSRSQSSSECQIKMKSHYIDRFIRKTEKSQPKQMHQKAADIRRQNRAFKKLFKECELKEQRLSQLRNRMQQLEESEFMATGKRDTTTRPLSNEVLRRTNTSFRSVQKASSRVKPELKEVVLVVQAEVKRKPRYIDLRRAN